MFITIHNLFADTCRGKEGYKPCFSEGCFLTIKMCDGYNDCEDWSDESDCKCTLQHMKFVVCMVVKMTVLVFWIVEKFTSIHK